MLWRNQPWDRANALYEWIIALGMADVGRIGRRLGWAIANVYDYSFLGRDM